MAAKDLRGSYTWEQLTDTQRAAMLREIRVAFMRNIRAAAAEVADVRRAMRLHYDASTPQTRAALQTRISLLDHRLWSLHEMQADPAFIRAYRLSRRDLISANRAARAATRTLARYAARMPVHTDRATLRTMNGLIAIVERSVQVYPLIERIPLPEMM